MDVESILNRYNKLEAKKSGYWTRIWKETRHYTYPNEESDIVEGGVRGVDIYDTTAIDARYRLAAGMYAWMAPPEQKWFELQAQDRELAEDDEIKIFFSKVSGMISEALANSNWPTILIEALNELACGLDAVIYCEDTGDDDILNFRRYRVEDVCYSENSKGKVDTVFTKLKMSARQIFEKFPEADLSEDIRSAAGDPARMETMFDVLHGVFPRSKRDPQMKDNRNMPFADVYVDMKSKTLLYESGYQENPYAICRFEKSTGESYGRGPGVNALPTVKMLNRYAQADIVGTEHLADPSYMAPDGSIVSKDFNRDPGSLIFYKPDVNGAKPEQLPNHFNPSLTMQHIEKLELKIKEIFFLDIFDPLGDMRNMTATEAEIRNESKIVPFAPIAGNLHNELFRTVIHRVLGILARRNLLPELPPKLAGNPSYRVEFVSKIARALRKVKILSWMQTEASIANIIPVHPEVADNFDFDKIVRDIAIVNGSEPDWLRPQKEVEAMRQDREQAAAAAANAQQMLAGVSALGNNMGKAPEPGSPLGMVLGGQGV